MGNLRRVKKELALNNCPDYYGGKCELGDLKFFTERRPKKKIKCKFCKDTGYFVPAGWTHEENCPFCNTRKSEKKVGRLQKVLDFLKGLCYNTHK